MTVKLIIAILRHEDTENVSSALIAAQFRITYIASSGGLLRHGLTTLMIGLNKEKVDEAIDVIRNSFGPAHDPADKRATLFVMNVVHYEQL
jgi:uncharacterized protein YaaQ